MKHTWITRILSAIFPYKVIINCDHDPYLVRWYVFKTKWVTLFIHKFIRSDEDRALHDHPWAFLVIPIWRGYYEHSECRAEYCDWPNGYYKIRQRVLPILGTRYRPALYKHRVELLGGWKRETLTVHPSPEHLPFPPQTMSEKTTKIELPAWSLFFHFKREREWGFHPPEGFTPWHKWWQDKCE